MAKPGVVPSLSRERVIAEALAIADREGIMNVSMRKLAANLGKTPMALYTYVDSIDDVRQGVIALVLDEVDRRPIPGERWDDTIRRTTRSIRRAYLNHWKAEAYKAEGGGDSPGVEKHTRQIFELHSAQGIPTELLDGAWCLIDAFLTGFCVAELSAMNDQARREATPDLPHWEQVVVSAYNDETFDRGIEMIIAGIRALAAPDPCEWYTPEQGSASE